MTLKLFSAVVLLTVLLATFAGVSIHNACASNPATDNEVTIVALSTDKDIYSAREEMNVFLSIYSPETITNAVITVSGVKSDKGVYYVSYSSNTNLTQGLNNITFTKKLPSCSRCAGISQGTYFIDATVTYGQKVVTATHSIAITSEPDQIIPVDIRADEARLLIDSEPEDLIVLDVRGKEAYDAAHIEGAVSIPLSELSNRTGELPKSSKIVVYSENVSDSTIACNLLINNEFGKVYNVVGGLSVWIDKGYPVVATTTNPAAPDFEAVLALAAVLAIALGVKRRRVA